MLQNAAELVAADVGAYAAAVVGDVVGVVAPDAIVSKQNKLK